MAAIYISELKTFHAKELLIWSHIKKVKLEMYECSRSGVICSFADLAQLSAGSAAAASAAIHSPQRQSILKCCLISVISSNSLIPS